MLFTPPFLFLICLFAASGRNDQGAQWPQFRGPSGQGISAGRNIPASWSADQNVAWKVAVPGQGWSSPVIAEDRIVLTTAETGGEISLRVLCLEAASGRILWNVEALKPSESDTKAVHKKNSLASPTAVIESGRIYAHFGHLGTAALELTSGKILWKQTALKYPPVHGNGGSPILHEGKLIFSCDGAKDPFVACLDAKDGRVVWKTPRHSDSPRTFSFSTPLLIDVDGKKQIISPASGFVGAYDPENGAEIWRVRYGEGYSVVPRPIFSNGLLFLSSGFDRPVIYAIDPKGAGGDVTDSHVRWKAAKGAPNTPSLLATGQELFAISDAGIATCFDQKTGEIIWNERLGGNFSSSPVLADDKIYGTNEQGVTFVLKATREYHLVSRNDLGERCLSSPAVLEGALFIRTESHLWKLGAR